MDFLGRGLCPRSHPTHQDAVLLAQFCGDGTDVSQSGCAQGAEEAGLAILMACEEAVLGDYQAARDTGAGSHPLGYDLDIGRRWERQPVSLG